MLIHSEQVAKHADKKDLYVVIHDKGRSLLAISFLWIASLIYPFLVYDATKFLDEHPGGEEVLLDMAGTHQCLFLEEWNLDRRRQGCHRCLRGCWSLWRSTRNPSWTHHRQPWTTCTFSSLSLFSDILSPETRYQVSRNPPIKSRGPFNSKALVPRIYL